MSALAHCISAAAAERKALDVRVIDLRGRASYADFLVIASGTSDRHVQAIAQGIEAALVAQQARCFGREGIEAGQWALLDCGSVVVHVFHPFTRSLYDLEGLWAQAPSLAIASESASPELMPPPADAMP